MRRLFCTTLALAMLVPAAAEPAKVKGTVRRARVQRSIDTLGYTVTQVAAPAKSLEQEDAEVVIFLRAKESKVLPKATEHLKMTFRGLEIIPEISGCEVDAQVVLLNQEPEPLTVMIGDDNFGVLKPNEERTYTCTAIKGNAESELRPVRVKEWPHIRGTIHVGDLGLTAQPDARGSFELNAVEGQYVLKVVAAMGGVAEKEVTVAKSDVDVGTIDLRSPEQRALDQRASEPRVPEPRGETPVAPKPRPPPPPPEEEPEDVEGDEGEAP
jgi:hypothetical protein